VVLVHGLGEHCRASVYEWLTPRLAAAGCAVWRFDLRGHGLSGGRRLSVESWDEFHVDLNHVLDEVGRPAVVFGFSLGGLVALDHQRLYAGRQEATIAMAPPLGDPSVPRMLLHLARGLNRVAPHWVVRSPWLPKFSRYATAELAAYRADRMIECAVTSRLAMALLERSRAVRRVERMAKPVLLIQGERDQICPAQAAREFAEKVGAEYREYAGARHHLLLEECREGVAGDVGRWVGGGDGQG
jgi:alpha-beta hydrolase superfamily lysophospholipase